VYKRQALDAATHPLDAGKHYVICANKENFMAYVGNSNTISEVIDVRTIHSACGFWGGDGNDWSVNMSASADFALSSACGWLQVWDNIDRDAVLGTVAWDQTGLNMDSSEIGPPWGGWAGSAINVSATSPGWGWLHSASEGSASAWRSSKYIFPGDSSYAASSSEWLLYTLESQAALLSACSSSGASAIELSSTLGFLDAGSAICEADVFTYTGRTTTQLTGIPTTGSLMIGDHASGAAINQMIDDVMQTGWPCSQLQMFRPHNPNLEYTKSGKFYTARTGAIAPRNPTVADWEQDYDSIVGTFAIGDGPTYDYSTTLYGSTYGTGPRWIQYLLIVFEEMSASSRARMNEVKLNLSQTEIDHSGLGDIGSITAGALAHYIFDQAGTKTYLSDATSIDLGPFIGEHATAIAPYTEVLDDLARITGCVVDWSLYGIPLWYHDLWWPMNYDNSYSAKFATLDATYLRGEINYSGVRPNEVGVKISARTPDGLSQYNAEFPANMTAANQKLEYDDLVIADINILNSLVQTMYYKGGLFYTEGAQEASFTLTGVGEWLRPEIWLSIFTNLDNGKCVPIPADVTTPEYVDHYGYIPWLVDSVTWEWGSNDRTKTWQANVHCRRYWQQ